MPVDVTGGEAIGGNGDPERRPAGGRDLHAEEPHQPVPGIGVGQCRVHLHHVGAVAVSLDSGGLGWLLPDDLEPVTTPAPWGALLPVLVPTIMGWRDRDFLLEPHPFEPSEERTDIEPATEVRSVEPLPEPGGVDLGLHCNCGALFGHVCTPPSTAILDHSPTE